MTIRISVVSPHAPTRYLEINQPKGCNLFDPSTAALVDGDSRFDLGKVKILNFEGSRDSFPTLLEIETDSGLVRWYGEVKVIQADEARSGV